MKETQKTLNEELNVIKKMMGLSEDIAKYGEPVGFQGDNDDTQYWLEGINAECDKALIIGTDYKTGGVEYHITFEIQSEGADPSVGYGGFDEVYITGGYKVPTTGNGEPNGGKMPLDKQDILFLSSKNNRQIVEIMKKIAKHCMKHFKDQGDKMGIGD